MALPELPDDRRAQPRRYEPAGGSAAARSAPPLPGRPFVPPDGRPAAPPPGGPRREPPGTRRPAGGSVPSGRPGPADDEPTEIVPRLSGSASSVDDGVGEAGSAAAGEAPGRHRRRAGESPHARPASSYPAPVRPDGRRPRTGRRRRPAFWRELPLLVVVALLLTFLIQTFLAKVYVIPSGSMETTLHGCAGCDNDRVLVDKLTYRFTEPEQGDIVVFRGPDGWVNTEFTVQRSDNPIARGLQQFGSLIGLAPPDEKDFVKRVIAVGGQTVQCCDSRNRLLVDGEPLDEPYLYYLPEVGPARQSAFGPVTVPEGYLWMMGDSRNNSADSRVAGHGPVPVDNVIGKARLIVLPVDRFGWIESGEPVRTVGLGAAPAGAPLAVGLLAVPLLLRRRSGPAGFLPPPGRSRR